MKHPTATLEGANLDYAVAVALGHKVLGKKMTFRDPGDGTFFVCGQDWGNPTPGGQLDFAERYTYEFSSGFVCGIPEYSKDWSQGGPIIERKYIDLTFFYADDHADRGVLAVMYPENIQTNIEQWGPTALTAAMRCFVASELGEEVEIP